MMLHCSRFIDLYLGKIPLPKWYKIFGVSIGRLFLWYVSKLDPSKTPRNLRTDKRIMVNDKSYDFENQRALLLKNINSLSKLSGTINHPIYGKMSSDKIIFLIWHHTSHHLNQFGINKKEQNKKPTQWVGFLSGQWGTRTPDFLLVREALWTNWVNRPNRVQI